MTELLANRKALPLMASITTATSARLLLIFLPLAGRASMPKMLCLVTSLLTLLDTQRRLNEVRKTYLDALFSAQGAFAALEEVVMALKVRGDQLPYFTGVETQHITRASRYVSAITGFPVQFNKAIVGKNAFAHESGIHQDGMLKDRGTYEIMQPEDVGQGGSNLVMGKHSGRHAFREKLKALGYELNQSALDEAGRLMVRSRQREATGLGYVERKNPRDACPNFRAAATRAGAAADAMQSAGHPDQAWADAHGWGKAMAEAAAQREAMERQAKQVCE